LSLHSGSQASQTAEMMNFYDSVTDQDQPAICLIVGDVNSSVACALVAAKKLIPIFHVEAGLRSNDRTMPEEINRLVIDSIAEIFYTPSIDADANLLLEGKRRESVVMVGNVMIDSFEMLRGRIEGLRAWEVRGLKEKAYGVVTFHRPANVDNPEILESIVKQLNSVSQKIPLVFPIHPRTKSKLEEFNLMHMLNPKNIVICAPLDYVEFMSLVVGSRLVITDSGGVQEETTYLGIPCLTVRENTERPITISLGTNKLVQISDLENVVKETLANLVVTHQVPKFWDGKTAERIVEHLRGYLSKSLASQKLR
jgi:UDP-N-acetylglucosamine 2-epimerase (non-hydrolysing)